MLDVVEIGNRHAFSFAARPQVVQDASNRNAAFKSQNAGRDVPDRPMPTSAVSRLDTPFLQQTLPVGGRGAVGSKPILLPHSPISQAESLVLSRAISDNVSGKIPEPTEGVNYKGLDPSWKVIPTARLMDETQPLPVEVLV